MHSTHIQLFNIDLYVGKEHGFMLSAGIPLGGDIFITAALQSNFDKTLHTIANIAKLLVL